jgi:aromatic ring-opening dioxygenase LigB subunit
MEKPTIIQFDENAYEEYTELQKAVSESAKKSSKPTYEQLLTSINNALKNIKVDYKYGDLIPRKYLPKDIIQKYGTDKIFRVELIGFWRLLYTIIGDEAKIIAFILEYMDHNKYNKLFGYKKK